MNPEERWYWQTWSAYTDPSSCWDDQEGWYGTGPDGTERMDHMWNDGQVGDTLTVTISPMVAVKLELVATLSSGMIFRRRAQPHVVYCVKKRLPYKLYQVELDTRAKRVAFHTIIGDEVHACSYHDRMRWADLRDGLADHFKLQLSQIRFIHNGWVGQRNMSRLIAAPLVPEDTYTPREFDPNYGRRAASPKPKAKDHAKAKAKATAKAKVMKVMKARAKAKAKATAKAKVMKVMKARAKAKAKATAKAKVMKKSRRSGRSVQSPKPWRPWSELALLLFFSMKAGLHVEHALQGTVPAPFNGFSASCAMVTSKLPNLNLFRYDSM